jgi:hypothetical protein
VPDVKPSQDGWRNLADWVAGLVLIYGFLFGVGKLVLMDYASGVALLALGLAGGSFIYFDLSRRGWSSLAE